MDTEHISRDGPILVLSFWTKLIEKVVARNIEHYICINDLYEIFQSTDRKDHSTDIAQIRDPLGHTYCKIYSQHL